MIRILLALGLLLAPPAALAEEGAPAAAEPPPIALPMPSPAAQAEQTSVQAWGGANSDCVEWSDGCVACTRDGCSTPGIACTPGEIVCRRK